MPINLDDYVDKPQKIDLTIHLDKFCFALLEDGETIFGKVKSLEDPRFSSLIFGINDRWFKYEIFVGFLPIDNGPKIVAIHEIKERQPWEVK